MQGRTYWTDVSQHARRSQLLAVCNRPCSLSGLVKLSALCTPLARASISYGVQSACHSTVQPAWNPCQHRPKSTLHTVCGQVKSFRVLLQEVVLLLVHRPHILLFVVACPSCLIMLMWAQNCVSGEAPVVHNYCFSHCTRLFSGIAELFCQCLWWVWKLACIRCLSRCSLEKLISCHTDGFLHYESMCSCDMQVLKLLCYLSLLILQSLSNLTCHDVSPYAHSLFHETELCIRHAVPHLQ